MNRLLFIAILLIATSAGWAEDVAQPAEALAPPKLPPQVESGEILEPDVTIIETEKGQIQQYSVNGNVYMVRIVPTSGPPYYLLDLDGDGTLDVRRDRPQDISIPQWVLFSW